MASSSSIPENLSSIVANMALAHEMIMNDDFKLDAISNSSTNRYIKHLKIFYVAIAILL